MKELHNHIFSNTTCISKEIMLKYINNQLSVKELHEMEKHLLDCEFCSEALEGLKYAENSSILFAIDNQIDQRVRQGGAKSPVMRNLMVAASILILFSVAFFTFDYFEGTVSNQSNLALKEATEKSVEDEVSKDKGAKNVMEETGAESTVARQDKSPLVENNNQREGKLLEANDNRINRPEAISEEPLEEVALSQVDEVDLLMEDEEEELSDNFEPQDVTVSMERAENESLNQPASANTESSGAAVIGNVLAKKSESKSNDDRDSNRNKKDKRKSQGNKKRSMSPGYVSESVAEEQKPLADDGLATVTLSTYKVVDYTDEYQRQYDLKNTVETKSVSADFATEEDKEVAEKEKEELEVALTYKETLEKGMAYLKMDKFVQALEQFNIILKEHPSEVNCQFYSGLSYFRLDQHKNADEKFDQVLNNERKEFEEDAYWYKALTLIELSKIDEAKKLLNNIVKGKGFYSSHAQKRLKDL